jgi:UPF0716 family protein affecting phage T7 exclusion
MTPLIGCFGLLLVAGVLAGEGYSFVVAHHLLGTYARDLCGGARWTDTLLPILLGQFALMVLGGMTVKRAINRLPSALMGSLLGQNADAGRLMVSMVAGILLIVPGFFLDVVGLLLLLPPLQAGFGKLGQRIAMSLVRQQMGKMFAGGMPGGGMPGGFSGGGFPGGAFPGMIPRGPLMPDARLGRGGKVVDVTAERVDKG